MKFLYTSNLNLCLHTLCLRSPVGEGQGAAHHGSVILWERARGIGKIGKVGVNDSHRLDPVMQKFGVFIIRDLQGTSHGIGR